MPQDPAGGEVRASDEDRERVVAALKDHCTAGRLTLEELPVRVERAYAATTLPELAELTYDLPGQLPRSAPRAPARTRPRMPGVTAFSEMIEFTRPVTEVETAVLRHIAPRLARYGFALVATDRRTLTFVRSGAIRAQQIQLTLDDLGDARTRLTAHGTAPLGIRRAFAELR